MSLYHKPNSYVQNFHNSSTFHVLLKLFKKTCFQFRNFQSGTGPVCMLVVNLCMFVWDFLFVKHLNTLVGILNVWFNCKDRWLYIFGMLNYNLHWFCKVVIFAISAANRYPILVYISAPTNLLLSFHSPLPISVILWSAVNCCLYRIGLVYFIVRVNRISHALRTHPNFRWY